MYCQRHPFFNIFGFNEHLSNIILFVLNVDFLHILVVASNFPYEKKLVVVVTCTVNDFAQNTNQLFTTMSCTLKYKIPYRCFFLNRVLTKHLLFYCMFVIYLPKNVVYIKKFKLFLFHKHNNFKLCFLLADV